MLQRERRREQDLGGCKINYVQGEQKTMMVSILQIGRKGRKRISRFLDLLHFCKSYCLTIIEYINESDKDFCLSFNCNQGNRIIINNLEMCIVYFIMPFNLFLEKSKIKIPFRCSCRQEHQKSLKVLVFGVRRIDKPYQCYLKETFKKVYFFLGMYLIQMCQEIYSTR